MAAQNEDVPTQTIPAVQESTRITDENGMEKYPRISADGKKLAYIWHNDDGQYSLLVKSLQTPDDKTLLYQSETPLQSPAWSPSGSELVFAKQSQNGSCSLYKIDVQTRQADSIAPCAANFTGSHDWSNNGRWIAYARAKNDQGGAGGIFLYDTQSHTSRQITTSEANDYLPFDFNWSPDDKVLAYTKMSNLSKNEIILHPVGGQPKQLTFIQAKIRGHSWAKDGKSIIFTANSGGQWALWQVEVATGKLTELGKKGKFFYPDYAAAGNALVYEKRSSTVNISKIPLADNTVTKASMPFIESIGSDSDVNYSPTSKQLVFNSDREGIRGIWLGNLEDSVFKPLGQAQIEANYPVISPDGKHVAYVALGAQKTYDQVFIVDSQTNQFKQLSKDPLPHLNPVWSSDGQAIYSSAPQDSMWNIWYYALNGDTPRQITKNGGIYAQQSSKDKKLYFTKLKKTGIWQLDLKTGDERLLFDTLYNNIQGNWTLVENEMQNGIYFFDRDHKADLIKYYDKPSGELSIVAELPQKSIKNSVLAYIPQQNALLYTHQGKRQSDIMLLGF